MTRAGLSHDAGAPSPLTGEGWGEGENHRAFGILLPHKIGTRERPNQASMKLDTREGQP